MLPVLQWLGTWTLGEQKAQFMWKERAYNQLSYIPLRSCKSPAGSSSSDWWLRWHWAILPNRWVRVQWGSHEINSSQQPLMTSAIPIFAVLQDVSIEPLEMPLKLTLQKNHMFFSDEYWSLGGLSQTYFQIPKGLHFTKEPNIKISLPQPGIL